MKLFHVPIYNKENNMQVQIHTDNHIEGTDAMSQWASTTVKAALARFAGQITRIEVHLSDENAGKKNTSESIQCTLEARLEGHQPLAIKHHGANLNQAIEGAAEKMSRLIDSTLGRSARG
ncbi:HPF/RaiA family ribosome-associated protein [Rhodoferax sp.]|uniref:HPF/RaiA family ribosome-associated protein n=1 Tax=Rhodoferax sp. TaxID=50421 RepID=UPI0025D351BD|nr:HPF/RaiA family ribosome-associated protein [Rhodoferax sp.]